MDQFGVRSPRLRALARTPVLPAVVAEAPATASAPVAEMTWQGARLRGLQGAEFSALGVAADAGGLLVEELATNGPACAAGLRPGDLLQQLNLRPLRGVAEFRQALQAAPPGQPRKLAVWRNQQSVVVEIPAALGAD
jgi:S1-C subfamily serine protease